MVVEMVVRLRKLNPMDLRQSIYQRYFMEILTHVIAIVTDYNQVPFVGLTNLAQAVCELFACAENDIQVSLNTSQSNTDYIFGVISNLFSTHFPNLTA
jgi:hypothetical protein